MRVRRPVSGLALVAGAGMVSALLAGCATTPRSAKADLYDQLHRTAALILVEGRMAGSAWLADPSGLVCTAAHVVPPGSENQVEVFWPAGEHRMPARLVARDPGNDLMLLQLDEVPEDLPYLKVADRQPEPGRHVYLFGSPLNRHDVMIEGSVARRDLTYTYFAEQGFYVRCYEVTAPSPPGSSGGAWVDEHGRVVGIQSGFHRFKDMPAGMAVVSPTEAIQRMLALREAPVRADLGCGLAELWSQSPGFIKRFPPGTAGLITIPIQADRAADRAGLHRESLLVAVDGIPLRYRDDLWSVLYAKQPGDRLVLTVHEPDTAEPHELEVELGRLR